MTQEALLLAAGKILAVLGLIAANGFFVASEFALVGVRRTRIDELVAQGDGTARLLQRAVAGLDDSLAATQLGVTISSLALGWVDEAALAGLVDQAQQDVVERAFAMGDRRVRAIMTPRHDIDWADANGTTDEILRAVRHGRHEQIVVAQGALDEVVGILRKQNLLDVHLDGKLPTADSEDGRAVLLRAVRAPLVIHDGAAVTQVLEVFKQRLVQMGLIYDEYGALRGVIT